MPVHAAGDEGLQRLLGSTAARFPGTLTVYVKHLKTGQEASVSADIPMHSMSVIKLAILVKAYQMAEQAALDLDRRVVLQAADRRAGSGILQFHASGLNPTIRDLLLEMVITSDNTATDLVLARVGGVASLNQWLQGAGFSGLRMVSSVFDYFGGLVRTHNPAYPPLSFEEQYAILSGLPLPANATADAQKLVKELAVPSAWEAIMSRVADDPARWLGSVTARDLGRLLEAIEAGTIVSKAHASEITQMMKAQQAGARRIPHFLDLRYDIAHKTGDGPPNVANDVGIVYLDSGPVVMVLLGNKIRGEYAEAEDLEGRIAQIVADFFDGPRRK
jgi:beta-lactamase class A